MCCLNGNDSYFVYPGTYFLCNENNGKSLVDAVCSGSDFQSNFWFKNSTLQIYVAKVKNESQHASHQCMLNSKLSRYSTDQFCHPDSNCCLTKDIGDLFSKTTCRKDYQCSNVSLYEKRTFTSWSKIAIKTFLLLVLMVGFFAITWNSIVILNSALVLRSKAIFSKEVKTYNFLLLNLAVADFLMGIHVAGVTAGSLKFISTKEDVSDDQHIEECSWLSSTVCSSLGVLNFLSSQASVSALVAISGLRLYGVYYPYRKLNLKVIIVVTAMVWLFWMAISCLPILNFEPFRSYFVDLIQLGSNGKMNKLRYSHLEYILQKLLDQINQFCGFYGDDGYNLKENLDWNTLFSIAKKLKLFNEGDLKDLTFISFYSVRRFCAPKFLVYREHNHFSFSRFVLGFNVISFIFIFIAQLAIAKMSFVFPKDHKTSKSNRWSCLFQSKCRNPMQRLRNMENQKMQIQMLLIVFTNFCCWIPVTIISIYYMLHITSQDACELLAFRRETEEWFYIFAMVAIPINSVINPFIYSISARKQIKKIFLRCCSRLKTANLNIEATTSTTQSIATLTANQTVSIT